MPAMNAMMSGALGNWMIGKRFGNPIRVRRLNNRHGRTRARRAAGIPDLPRGSSSEPGRGAVGCPVRATDVVVRLRLGPKVVLSFGGLSIVIIRCAAHERSHEPWLTQEVQQRPVDLLRSSSHTPMPPQP